MALTIFMTFNFSLEFNNFMTPWKYFPNGHDCEKFTHSMKVLTRQFSETTSIPGLEQGEYSLFSFLHQTLMSVS